MHIDLTYSYLTHHIVPGPQSFSYFVPLILLPTALLIPRTLLSKWTSIALFMPAMTLATLHAWTKMGGVDVISVDALLWAVYLLILRDPWNGFSYVGRATEYNPENGGGGEKHSISGNLKENGSLSYHGVDGDGAKTTSSLRYLQGGNSYEQAYPHSLKERLPWVFTLLTSIRMQNWKIGRPSHDKAQPPAAASVNRRSFLVRTLISSIRGFLVLDLTRAYVSYDSYFTDTNVPIWAPHAIPWLPFVPPRLLRSAIIGSQAWACISELFYLPCLLPVGLNATGILPDEWSPHTWSPYFGPSQVVLFCGVRGFWGQYWHQSMRSFASEPGYAIADLLSLKRGGLVRYATITTVAFGLTGCIHVGLVPPEPLHATVGVNAIRLSIAAFFWVQPIAMFVEVLTIRVVSRLVPTYSWQSELGLKCRLIGNGIWLTAWFTFCLPLLGEAARQLGYWRIWPLPVSIWKGVRGEGWIAWQFLTT